MSIKINRSEWLRLKRQFGQWVLWGSEVSVNKGAKVLTKNYQNLIDRGLNSDGSSMKPVTNSTMNQPIRRGGPDKRIRKEVNPNKNRPINATGESIKSISLTRSGKTWTIAPKGKKANQIFERNKSLGRDPLTVSDKQIDQMEEILIDDVMKIIGKV